MKIKSFVFNPFYENTFVLWDDTKKGIIVDPGCYEKYEVEEITEFIAQQDIKITAIVNTHCHIDHVLGNYTMKTKYGCPLLIPAGELQTYKAVEVYAPNYGMGKFTFAEPDFLLQEEHSVSFGDTDLKIILCPGHAPGHMMFYHEQDAKIIGGDVLFRESIGRTDLPGGNHTQLLTNIKEKLYTLPDHIEVFPGHGPSTTIGHERKYNPFVKG